MKFLVFISEPGYKIALFPNALAKKSSQNVSWVAKQTTVWRILRGERKTTTLPNPLENQESMTEPSFPPSQHVTKATANYSVR